jgi:hypothetical protein
MTDIQDAFKLSEEYRKRLNEGGGFAPFFTNKPTFYYDIKDIVLDLGNVQCLPVSNATTSYLKLFQERIKETK